MSKIIWQPSSMHKPGIDFCIAVDIEFARKMCSFTLPHSISDSLQILGCETGREYGCIVKKPYELLKKTGLVSRISLLPRAASLELHDLDVGVHCTKPLMYFSRNTINSHDAYILMALVDRWVTCAPRLEEYGVSINMQENDKSVTHENI
jgi:hypothetical protein